MAFALALAVAFAFGVYCFMCLLMIIGDMVCAIVCECIQCYSKFHSSLTSSEHGSSCGVLGENVTTKNRLYFKRPNEIGKQASERR